MVVATIKKQSAFQLESSADVYIHNVSWGKGADFKFKFKFEFKFSANVYIQNVRQLELGKSYITHRGRLRICSPEFS